MAMNDEYNALLRNDTWQLQELPKGQKVVSNKWVFAFKRNTDGDVQRFKARLVAKGCAQVYGVNYTETFSPVVINETIRLIFAIAAEYELYLEQMDVSSAHWHSTLEDEIYMKQPECFKDTGHPD